MNGNHIDSYCNDCRKIRRRINYEKNKDRQKELCKKWVAENKDRHNYIRKLSRQKIRLEVLNHYSNGDIKCNCCGEINHEFLAIDHINNDGAENKRNGEPKGGIGFYTYLRKNNYPEGFQILCHNCNMAKAFYGICPHKR